MRVVWEEGVGEGSRGRGGVKEDGKEDMRPIEGAERRVK